MEYFKKTKNILSPDLPEKAIKRRHAQKSCTTAHSEIVLNIFLLSPAYK